MTVLLNLPQKLSRKNPFFFFSPKQEKNKIGVYTLGHEIVAHRVERFTWCPSRCWGEE